MLPTDLKRRWSELSPSDYGHSGKYSCCCSWIPFEWQIHGCESFAIAGSCLQEVLCIYVNKLSLNTQEVSLEGGGAATSIYRLLIVDRWSAAQWMSVEIQERPTIYCWIACAGLIKQIKVIAQLNINTRESGGGGVCSTTLLLLLLLLAGGGKRNDKGKYCLVMDDPEFSYLILTPF